MRRVLVFFLLGWLFFQGWTSAFALAPILPLHVVFGTVSIGGFVLYLFASGSSIRTEVYKMEDALLGALIIFLTIAALVHPRETAVNYIAAYTYTFLGGYLILKGALYNLVSADTALKWVLIGVLVTAVGSILEFGLTFFLGIDLNPYLFRLRPSEAIYGGLFPRSAAFSTEPGILAFYFETLGVVGLWTLWNRSWDGTWKMLFTTVIVLGWMLTFSAASMAALTIGGTVALLVKHLFSQRRYARIIPFLFVPLLIVGIALVFEFARDTLLRQILLKISLQGEGVSSAANRLSQWREALRAIADHPLFGEGVGTAAAQGETSSISWYLFLVAEAGLLTIAPVLIFIITKFNRILGASVSGKYWFAVAIIAASIHLSVISTFFHPFMWTSIALFEIVNNYK